MSTAINWICSVDIKPFPAVWGYRLMLESTFTGHTLWPLIVIFLAAVVLADQLDEQEREEKGRQKFQ
jgi:hypothetical protein